MSEYTGEMSESVSSCVERRARIRRGARAVVKGTGPVEAITGGRESVKGESLLKYVLVGLGMD